MVTVRHYHHHYHFSYTTSLRRHFSSTVLVLLILIPILIYILNFVFTPSVNSREFSILDLLSASSLSLSRLSIAYLISVIAAVPLSLLITATPKLEKVLLPIFDVIQSIPILAFFPLVVLVFIKLNYFNGAAIFVIAMQEVWILVFTMIGGIKTVPEDVKSAALVFGAKGFKKLIYITLPAIFPYIITGSLLAWSAGWNILVIAEVIHAYLPNGKPSQDLFGLGSLMINASSSGQNLIFIASLATMILLIGLINFFVWQKLLAIAERYKFD